MCGVWYVIYDVWYVMCECVMCDVLYVMCDMWCVNVWCVMCAIRKLLVVTCGDWWQLWDHSLVIMPSHVTRQAGGGKTLSSHIMPSREILQTSTDTGFHFELVQLFEVEINIWRGSHDNPCGEARPLISSHLRCEEIILVLWWGETSQTSPLLGVPACFIRLSKFVGKHCSSNDTLRNNRNSHRSHMSHMSHMTHMSHRSH